MFCGVYVLSVCGQCRPLANDFSCLNFGGALQLRHLCVT